MIEHIPGHLVNHWLQSWVLRGRVPNAERTPHGDGWVLRYTSRYCAFILVNALIWLFLSLCVVEGAFGGNPTATLGMIAFFGLIASLSVYYLMYVLWRRVLVLEHGLVIKRLFAGSVYLVWDDLERLTYSNLLDVFRLRTKGGSVYWLSVYLNGLGTLGASVANHAPGVLQSSALPALPLLPRSGTPTAGVRWRRSNLLPETEQRYQLPTVPTDPDRMVIYFDEMESNYLAADAAGRAAYRRAMAANPKTAEALLGSYLEEVKKRAEATGEPTKCVRAALLAISLTDGFGDSRDTLLWLPRLWQYAEENGIDPAPHFREIGEISSPEVVHVIGGPARDMILQMLDAERRRILLQPF